MVEWLRIVASHVADRAPDGWRVEHDGPALRLRGPDGEVAWLPGNRVRAVFHEAYNRGRDHLDAIAGEIAERVRADEASATRLDASILDRVFPTFSGGDGDLVSPWVPPLHVQWGVLSGRTEIQFQRIHLRQLGVDKYRLHEIALENLERVPVAIARLPEGLVAYLGGGCPILNAEQVLVESRMHALAQAAGCHDLAVALPTRYLVVAGAYSSETLKSLSVVSWMLTHMTADGLCSQLFRWTDGEWTSLEHE